LTKNDFLLSYSMCNNSAYFLIRCLDKNVVFDQHVHSSQKVVGGSIMIGFHLVIAVSERDTPGIERSVLFGEEQKVTLTFEDACKCSFSKF
jgi:hypothetical protein